MHRRGEHIGSFFLANKEGGQEFTDADEEVLLLFASQAAMAIANARTHPPGAPDPGRPRGPGGDLAGRHRGLQRQDPARRGRSTIRHVA